MDHRLGERHHPVAEGRFGRIQAVESEQAQQRTQAGRGDEEREEHVADRQLGDEVLHRGRHGRVLADRKREHHGHRAAQAAPENHRLVPAADRLGQLHLGQQRQQAVEHEGAGDQGGEHQDQQQAELGETHGRQQARGQDCGQQEDQRVGPEVELVPDMHQGLPGLRVDPRPALDREGQTGSDHGEYAGDAQVMLGDQIAEVGQADRERDLGHRRVAQTVEQAADQPAEQAAEGDPAEEVDQEGQAAGPETEVATADQQIEQQGEDGDRRRVVEQAFPRDQGGQTARRAEVAEDAEDRRGVGGRNDGTEQQAGDQAELGDGVERQPDHRGRHHDGDHGQQQDRCEFVEQQAHVDRQGRGEEQRRQEQEQQGVGREPEHGEAAREVANHAEAGELAEQADREAEHHTEGREQGGAGQGEAVCERQHQADQGQQDGGHEDDGGDIGHGSNRAGFLRKLAAVGGAGQERRCVA